MQSYRLRDRIAGVLSLLALLLVLPHWGHTVVTHRYVNQGGTDNSSCSIGSQCAHIWKALAVGAPGDVICTTDVTAVAYDGTWENGQTGEPGEGTGGSSDQRVVYFSSNLTGTAAAGGTSGNHTILSNQASDCGSTSPATISRLNGPGGQVLYYGIEIRAPYVTIRGFRVYGGADTFTKAYCDTFATPQLQPNECKGVGIGVYSQNITLDGVEPYLNNQSGIDGSQDNIGGQPDCILLKNVYSHDNSWYGKSGGSNSSLLVNTNSGSCDESELTTPNARIRVVRSAFIAAFEQLTETETGHISDGNGMILGGSSPVSFAGLVLLDDDIFAGNSGTGSHAINMPSATVKYRNVTAYKNEQTPVGSGSNQSGQAAGNKSNGEIAANNTPVDVQNSILVSKDNTSNSLFGVTGASGAMTSDYNVLQGAAQAGGNNGGGTFSQGGHDIVADPQLIAPSTSIPVGNFRPGVGSPVIGAMNTAGGIFINALDYYGAARPQGASYDTGCCEFIPSSLGVNGGYGLRMAAVGFGGSPGGTPAPVTQCFASNGTFNQLTNGSNINVAAIGAGGGGAGSNGGVSIGGPGGGGEWRMSSLAYSSGTNKAVVIGAGGAGGAVNAGGTAGGNTTWDGTVLIANGGLGGTAAGAAGAGGTGGTGTTHNNGGAGGANDQAGWAAAGGGGAGGPDGAGAAGGAGSGATHGGAGGGGGDGGSVGAATGSTNGTAGGAAFDSTAGGVGGAGGASPAAGSPGSHGSGGGGGGGGTTGGSTGGAGGAGGAGLAVSDGTASGGGGAGGGGIQASATGGAGGTGGLYGGGGGGGGYSSTAGAGGSGAGGRLCVTYTP